MMYRVGLPFWKTAARHGAPLRLRVKVTRDDEAGVFVAVADGLVGLVVEAPTMDELVAELRQVAGVLVELAIGEPAKKPVRLRMDEGAFRAA